MKQWLLRISAWVSQTINLWLLFGHHDMTVSARCYINRHKPYWNVAYKVINKLFWFQKNHCKESFDEDIKYAEEVQRYVDNNR
jgi:hypothetical protein